MLEEKIKYFRQIFLNLDKLPPDIDRTYFFIINSIIDKKELSNELKNKFIDQLIDIIKARYPDLVAQATEGGLYRFLMLTETKPQAGSIHQLFDPFIFQCLQYLYDVIHPSPLCPLLVNFFSNVPINITDQDQLILFKMLWEDFINSQGYTHYNKDGAKIDTKKIPEQITYRVSPLRGSQVRDQAVAIYSKMISLAGIPYDLHYLDVLNDPRTQPDKLQEITAEMDIIVQGLSSVRNNTWRQTIIIPWLQSLENIGKEKRTLVVDKKVSKNETDSSLDENITLFINLVREIIKIYDEKLRLLSELPSDNVRIYEVLKNLAQSKTEIQSNHGEQNERIQQVAQILLTLLTDFNEEFKVINEKLKTCLQTKTITDPLQHINSFMQIMHINNLELLLKQEEIPFEDIKSTVSDFIAINKQIHGEIITSFTIIVEQYIALETAISEIKEEIRNTTTKQQKERVEFLKKLEQDENKKGSEHKGYETLQEHFETISKSFWGKLSSVVGTHYNQVDATYIINLYNKTSLPLLQQQILALNARITELQQKKSQMLQQIKGHDEKFKKLLITLAWVRNDKKETQTESHTHPEILARYIETTSLEIIDFAKIHQNHPGVQKILIKMEEISKLSKQLPLISAEYTDPIVTKIEAYYQLIATKLALLRLEFDSLREKIQAKTEMQSKLEINKGKIKNFLTNLPQNSEQAELIKERAEKFLASTAELDEQYNESVSIIEKINEYSKRIMGFMTQNPTKSSLFDDKNISWHKDAVQTVTTTSSTPDDTSKIIPQQEEPKPPASL